MVGMSDDSSPVDPATSTSTSASTFALASEEAARSDEELAPSPRAIRARRLLVAAGICLGLPLVYGGIGIEVGTSAAADVAGVLCLVLTAVCVALVIASIVTFRALPAGTRPRRVAAAAGGVAALAVPANLFGGALVLLAWALGEGLHGRPWRVAGHALRTPIRRPEREAARAGDTSSIDSVEAIDGWARGDASELAIGSEIEAVVAEAATLSPALRARLSAAWAADASLEHASVAAFSALSLDLLALAAPPALLRRAHAAALDEIGHAQIGFALASAYAGTPVLPGPLTADDTRQPSPLPTPAETHHERLIRVACETAVDGCVGERAAAEIALLGSRLCENGSVAALLARIAVEEQRHADFAWDLLVHLLGVGGEPVRRAVIAALAAPTVDAGDGDGSGDDESARDGLDASFRAHGRVGSAEWRRARERAREAVVASVAGWKATRRVARTLAA
jgi:hypothetical protein